MNGAHFPEPPEIDPTKNNSAILDRCCSVIFFDDRGAGRGNEGLERDGGRPPARSNSSSSTLHAGIIFQPNHYTTTAASPFLRRIRVNTASPGRRALGYRIPKPKPNNSDLDSDLE
jgi:hypothetical protein